MRANHLSANGAFVMMVMDGMTFMKMQIMSRNSQYPNGMEQIRWYRMMPDSWDICADPAMLARLNQEFVRLIEDIQVKMFNHAKRGFGNDQISG